MKNKNVSNAVLSALIAGLISGGSLVARADDEPQPAADQPAAEPAAEPAADGAAKENSCKGKDGCKAKHKAKKGKKAKKAKKH